MQNKTNTTAMSKPTQPLDTSRTVDISFEELDKIKRRADIRRNLQNEFNRVIYNPYRQVYRVHFVSGDDYSAFLLIYTSF